MGTEDDGLAKLWDKGLEGVYAIKHGSIPVKDFPEPEADSESSFQHLCSKSPTLINRYSTSTKLQHRPK